MKLFLHIGTEKTGSSYLQTLFALNRNQLKKYKIYYPEAGKREKDALSGKINPGNGRQICSKLEKTNYHDVEKLLIKYKKDALYKQCTSILISNENLIEPFSSKVIITNFNRICENHGINSIEMLLVLRDPVDQALSLYKHRAKNGEEAHLKQWIDTAYHLPQYLGGFISLIDEFKVNCTFRKYQKKSSAMVKIAFEDWLNVGYPEVEYNSLVNPSLSISELLILKKLASNRKDLVADFYERMLSIPKEMKAKDYRIEEYYKFIISRKLIQNLSIWEEYNKRLAENEKLTTPVLKETEKISSEEILCFSEKQVDEFTHFLVNSSNPQMRIKIFQKNIRKKLSRIKKNLLK